MRRVLGGINGKTLMFDAWEWVTTPQAKYEQKSPTFYKWRSKQWNHRHRWKGSHVWHPLKHLKSLSNTISHFHHWCFVHEPHKGSGKMKFHSFASCRLEMDGGQTKLTTVFSAILFCAVWGSGRNWLISNAPRALLDCLCFCAKLLPFCWYIMGYSLSC